MPLPLPCSLILVITSAIDLLYTPGTSVPSVLSNSPRPTHARSLLMVLKSHLGHTFCTSGIATGSCRGGGAIEHSMTR